MDRLIYIAMTGAKHAMTQQATHAQNLANATTGGFRAELAAFRAAPVIGEGLPTRAYSVTSTPGSDFTPGPVHQTGRDLDVAVQGKGWIAVEGDDGKEAYTRRGSLTIDANGVLQTDDGRNVLGDGGPLSIPPDSQITIAKDGTVSAVLPGQSAAVAVVGRIKLVNPDDKLLLRGDDGLFRTQDGNPADADINVTLSPSSLEGSNVNVVDAMTRMIADARQYDLQVKLVQKADENERSAGQLLRLNG